MDKILLKASELLFGDEVEGEGIVDYVEPRGTGWVVCYIDGHKIGYNEDAYFSVIRKDA